MRIVGEKKKNAILRAERGRERERERAANKMELVSYDPNDP